MRFSTVKVILFLGLIIFFWSCKSFSQEKIPKITIETQVFTKLTIRIPNFEGEQPLSQKLSSLLRRLINAHLFVLSLENPPLPGFKTKDYYLKGHLSTKNNKLFLKAELWDLFENKILKTYHLEGTLKKPELSVYTLCNKIIEDISNYKGLAFSRVSFVKRTKKGDELYIMDFSKENLRFLTRAPLILFPKMSPSGRKLAYLVYENRDYILEILDLYNGHKKQFILNGLTSSPVWLPEETKLILTIGKKEEINLYLLEIETSKLTLLTSEKGVQQAGSVSKDGKYLAYVWDKGTGPQIYLLNLQTFEKQRISYEGKYNTAPKFSPKGDYIIYLSQAGGATRLILYNIQTKTKKEISLRGLVEEPSFSPTGEYLLVRAKLKEGTGFYIIHLDSQISHLYLSGNHLLFPDWGPLLF